MATGNGAYIVHKVLETYLSCYSVYGYHPCWTTFPPSLLLMCRSGRHKLIHTTPDYGIFFRRRCVRLMLTFHNLVLDGFMARYSTPFQRIHYRTNLRWFTRAALRYANAVTSVSRFTAALVRSELKYEGEIRVIHNGVDAEKFYPSTSRNHDSLGVRVLYSGNLTIRKGVFLIPKIASRLDPGITIHYTRGLRNRLFLPPSSNLRDIGAIPYNSMPDLYRKMDILLLPTVREGLSLAVLEAMASGLPVVGTNCSSMPELIDHGKGGFLCNLDDPMGFAEGINILAGDSSLRRRMGDYNRAKVEKYFTLQAMLDSYKQVFSSILAENQY